MTSQAARGSEKIFHFVEWAVVATVLLAVVIAWVQSRNIFERGVDELSLFPLFGLIAFMLMWSHFVLGVVRRMMGLKKRALGAYWVISSALVLGLIILHPLLLNYRLVADGLGLPPGSYQAAYGDKALFLMLGTVCLLIFLSFELRRWFKEKTWWKYVEYLQVGAMAGIFIHALMLGQELSLPWFWALWWLCGLVLVGAWVYNYRYDKAMNQSGNGDGEKQ